MGHKYEQYVHHGTKVSVRKDLRGRHREFCLCFACDHFKPEDRTANCPTANLLYALCVRCGLTTPVFECTDFDPR